MGRYKISGKLLLKIKTWLHKRWTGRSFCVQSFRLSAITFPFLEITLFLHFPFFSFVAFNQVRIPRENLLGNKTADVTPAGEYVTPFKDPNKRFGAALGALSAARVGITSIAVTNLRACVPIAIRWDCYF